MEWKRESVCELIRLYRERPQLWDSSRVDYKNASKKRDAIEDIASELKITAGQVERKIATIRAQFLREHAKVRSKRRSTLLLPAATNNDVYAPKWYGYKLLDFLIDVATSRPVRAIADKPKEIIAVVDNVETNDASDGKRKEKKKEEQEKEEGNLQRSLNSNFYEFSEETSRRELSSPKRFKLEDLATTTISMTTTSTSTSMPTSSTRRRSTPKSFQPRIDQVRESVCRNDEFASFGEYVGTAIRKMRDKYWQCYARHKISEILFQVESQCYAATSQAGQVALRVATVTTTTTTTTSTTNGVDASSGAIATIDSFDRE